MMNGRPESDYLSIDSPASVSSFIHHSSFCIHHLSIMAANITSSEAVKPALEAKSGAGEQIVAFIEALMLTVWLGAMIFFSVAVAPSAFAVLPTRALAGQVVS